jgi:hypothetical protein
MKHLTVSLCISLGLLSASRAGADMTCKGKVDGGKGNPPLVYELNITNVSPATATVEMTARLGSETVICQSSQPFAISPSGPYDDYTGNVTCDDGEYHVWEFVYHSDTKKMYQPIAPSLILDCN